MPIQPIQPTITTLSASTTLTPTLTNLVTFLTRPLYTLYPPSAIHCIQSVLFSHFQTMTMYNPTFSHAPTPTPTPTPTLPFGFTLSPTTPPPPPIYATCLHTGVAWPEWARALGLGLGLGLGSRVRDATEGDREDLYILVGPGHISTRRGKHGVDVTVYSEFGRGDGGDGEVQLIAIAKSRRSTYWNTVMNGDVDVNMDRDRDVGVVIPPPILLPRLLVFGDGMEVDDDDVFHDDHNEAVHDVDVHDAVDVDSSDSDSDSDSESTTSTTSHISDISSITSVSSSSSIAKSSPATAGVVYVPPHKHSFTKSASEYELRYEYESSIPSHRLPPSSSHSHSHSRSHFHSHHPRRHLGLGLARMVVVDTPKSQSQSKSPTHVNRYKHQAGETGVMTGGVMLGSTTRSPFTPVASTRSPLASTRSPLASTRSRPPLARPTKRGTARTLILGPDSSSSSSSLDWRRPRPRLRVPSVPVA